jgi:lysyl-tRNA synthetase class I
MSKVICNICGRIVEAKVTLSNEECTVLEYDCECGAHGKIVE